MTDKKPTRHKIGSTRTMQTAVLVVAYLETRHLKFNDGRTRYVFHDAQTAEKNGWWIADIIADTYGSYDPKTDAELTEMVNECRAFVAGRGEIWT